MYRFAGDLRFALRMFAKVPVTTAAVLLVAVVARLAALGPARRAIGVDPMAVLRQE